MIKNKPIEMTISEASDFFDEHDIFEFDDVKEVTDIKFKFVGCVLRTIILGKDGMEVMSGRFDTYRNCTVVSVLRSARILVN